MPSCWVSPHIFILRTAALTKWHAHVSAYVCTWDVTCSTEALCQDTVGFSGL